MVKFSYSKPASALHAITQKAAGENSSFVAGGSNIIDLIKYNVAKPASLIDVGRLEEFSKIESTPAGGLMLGATAKNSDTAYHPAVEEKYPLLSKAILAGASAQIRNMASNGGNLLQRTRCYYFYDVATPCNKREPGTGCSAITGLNRMHAVLGQSESCIAVFPSDMCVALAALEAVVHVEGAGGKRTIPFESFHRLPGNTPQIDNNLSADELITGIELPPEDFSKNYSYLKIRDRDSYAFALVSVATAFRIENNVIEDARVAMGGVAHKPWRVKAGEDFLIGKNPSRENFSAAAEIILAGATSYPFNYFKIELGKRAVIRNCMMALDPQTQRPGAKASL